MRKSPKTRCRETSAPSRNGAPPFPLSKLAIAVAAASGLGAAPSLHAQEASASAPALEEVIVTARKRESNIQDTPVSIQAFTSDDLESGAHRWAPATTAP